MKIFKILLLLLLSCGSLHVQASSEEEPPAEGAEVAAKPGFSYHALDPDIITNYLSDGKTLGYIRVTVELMAENEGDLKLLEQHDPLIRDAIIRLMGSKTADQIKSLVNREELRKECLTQVNELLVKETGKKAVRELIFTKFLYQ
ncbi:flagellar basal body-associated FliL family protein [Aeromonas salmonicida]|jgi:flagellar FliL protein|uniref:flagellar basal body-associated FliL family protein n=1 Tax=Aeromonas salmonicida TaxID=645 RepID=UPI000B40388B|nr:flagellar basal body-associated FliL family protein [Aeromonas salmonicida]ARW84260.1 flagellar basal body-associated protein FliL [Aeromonas salmonicida]MDM5069686.1 flagellar basal body-associated FliL family protein [Aeromonas salmonicida]MDQ1886611.1 flagellar basal body-associated FliL family protein [Aeromonas salmonicida]MUG30595.1 flagellar basal body-associated protein FliL [Aeromonas salmonicida]VFB11378.1 flagellar basal body-associated protein FliL [Aeromonas salmonicida]